MSYKQSTILVVDDEKIVTDFLREDLVEEGYSCVTADTGENALQQLSINKADVALLDLRLPGISGMHVLREIKSTYPRTAVIVITAAGDAETAVEAMKSGAMDYITKPFELERLHCSIETVLQAVWVSKPTSKEEVAKIGDEEENWARHLDDIACGVETRLDSLTGHMMTITTVERTVAIAQSLDIPEDEIKKWTDARRKHIERINTLDSLLDKMETHPVA